MIYLLDVLELLMPNDYVPILPRLLLTCVSYTITPIQ